MDNVYAVKGTPVTFQSLTCFEGHLPTELEELTDDQRMIKWKGARIPWYMWDQIKAFFKWTLEEFQGEAQVRLYYNPELSLWRTVCLPQETSVGGLSTKEKNYGEERDKALEGVNPEIGWQPAGTVHHHCTIGAFQSGTDHSDEHKQPGIHITLGNLDKDVWDIHARVTFKGLPYGLTYAEWLDTSNDEHVKTPRLTSFPEEWKSRVSKRTFGVFTDVGSMYKSPRPKTALPARTSNASTQKCSISRWYMGEEETEAIKEVAMLVPNLPFMDVPEPAETEEARAARLDGSRLQTLELFAFIAEALGSVDPRGGNINAEELAMLISEGADEFDSIRATMDEYFIEPDCFVDEVAEALYGFSDEEPEVEDNRRFYVDPDYEDMDYMEDADSGAIPVPARFREEIGEIIAEERGSPRRLGDGDGQDVLGVGDSEDYEPIPLDCLPESGEVVVV